MIYRIAAKLERIGARLQGKGWAGATTAKEVKRLTKLLRNPKLAIDVGGNIGNYTALLRQEFKEIEVHLFEPSFTNYEKLHKRFAGDEKVIINQAAVSDHNGVSELFSNTPGSSLASLTKRKLDHYGLEFNTAESVETIRFEDYWKSKLTKKAIDLLKIDVEGHELDVLNGLGESILKTKIVQFEFGGTNIDTKTFFRDFWYFFKDYPFKIYRITPLGLLLVGGYNETDESFTYSNFLCINKDI